MNADWLAKYPKAAAMLQGDDDVLLYEPQSCRGLEEMRRLRDSGQMSREEFDAARAAIIGRVSGRAPASAPTRAPSGDAGVRVARPGFDLTGRPLPGSKENGPKAGPTG